MIKANPARTKVSLAKKDKEAEVAATVQVAAAATRRQTDALALIMARNEFYKRNVMRMIGIMVGQAGILILLIVLLSSIFGYTSSRDYFFPVRNDNTRIIEKPLFDPIYTDEKVIEWAEKAVTQTLTFGYYDHALRLQESRNFFTIAGWATFNTALSQAQILERMNAVQSEAIKGRNKVLVSTIKPGTRSLIKGKGLMNGLYSWQVEMQVNAAYRELDRETGEPWKVNVFIIRTMFMDSRDGIGINQIVTTRASAS